MVDNFSKFVKIGALKDRTSGTLAKWLMDEIIGIFGPSMTIKSDNRSEFKGLFESICQILDIRHHKILPHHPQGNGIAERFVQITKYYLIR